MKATPSLLTLTTLEDRLQPATFGQPWAGADHLTLSFVPDGTGIDNQSSTLFGKLEAGGLPRATWQAEVLKAFQTWSQVAGVTVDVVPDSGAPLGAAGFTQGDSRFGDIRVAARPLSDSVLAITTAPGIIGDTRAGDIVLNSNKLFAVGDSLDGAGKFASFDLYSAVLQEAGHALGVGNSPDRASPMFEQYVGRRTKLATGDVTQIQALYGARQADQYEGYYGNNTPYDATDLLVTKTKKKLKLASVSASADISTATDVDYYRVTVPKDGVTDGMTVQVKTRGGSGMTARVTVTDDSGRTLGTGTSVNGTAEVKLAAVYAKSSYYVRVEADAGSTAKVSKYKLSVSFDPSAPNADASTGVVLDDTGTDDTFKTATALAVVPGYADGSRYAATAVLRTASDVDFYYIQAPKLSKGETNLGSVSINTLESGGQPPVVEVFDGKMKPLSTQIVANGGGVYTVQFDGGVTTESKFYLRVSAADRGAAAVGVYQVDTNFRQQVVSLTTYASGTLTTAAPIQYRQLDIARSQMQFFSLTTTTQGAVGRTAVAMTIYDAAGATVTTLFAKAGDTVSKSIYLAPGRYTVAFAGGVRSGPTMDAASFTLRGTVLTDPIGSGAVDSDGHGVPVIPPTSPPPPPPPRPPGSPQPPPPPPPPGSGQPPPDYVWNLIPPAPLVVVQSQFVWRNPWGP